MGPAGLIVFFGGGKTSAIADLLTRVKTVAKATLFRSAKPLQLQTFNPPTPRIRSPERSKGIRGRVLADRYRSLSRIRPADRRRRGLSCYQKWESIRIPVKEQHLR